MGSGIRRQTLAGILKSVAVVVCATAALGALVGCGTSSSGVKVDNPTDTVNSMLTAFGEGKPSAVKELTAGSVDFDAPVQTDAEARGITKISDAKVINAQDKDDVTSTVYYSYSIAGHVRKFKINVSSSTDKDGKKQWLLAENPFVKLRGLEEDALPRGLSLKTPSVSFAKSSGDGEQYSYVIPGEYDFSISGPIQATWKIDVDRDFTQSILNEETEALKNAKYASDYPQWALDTALNQDIDNLKSDCSTTLETVSDSNGVPYACKNGTESEVQQEFKSIAAGKVNQKTGAVALEGHIDVVKLSNSTNTNVCPTLFVAGEHPAVPAHSYCSDDGGSELITMSLENVDLASKDAKIVVSITNGALRMSFQNVK
ncbi:hypothetical protein [Bifidobacterium crudilactis]|jgi:hypothetical protein|uniref:hypothetical protein n=1 Tax=Bifidobacterium crudilactis TaxID=327277 RepID=UPI002648D098|nr:hypothetical protein [Bifidobacterium crudilactis]MDN6446542.1 hypothetical protein [Lacticaseibacillus paracasei]MDN5972159.1 hypothetical protein [Bifidobacterium crudilactis]MDN6000663.1 hypothetical protein [Bifidobacterium crudilactis]MDN6208554.1 hypothetical protein [Bifidobacterium crudilactis]MDN6233515.1 hypothetical protein [Bifidobacterium crudilactis]